jgi:CDP-glycerol glycerophosphotransferase (TagB/SpsB family)
MNKLRLLPTILTILLLRTSHSLCSLLFPLDHKKITFSSYRTDSIQGNLLYIHNELLREYPNFQYTLLFKKLYSTKLGKLSQLLNMIKATYHLATSKYFIIDDYYFPVYAIIPRNGTEIVQVWHAAGAFKKFGYSTIGKEFGPSLEYLKYVKIHSNYSKVLVSSDEVVPYYAEAFQTPESRVIPIGLPRTDFFFNQNNHDLINNKFYNDYPNIKNKKIILYAPTYRGKSNGQKAINVSINFMDLKEKLSDEYVVIIHLHPYISESIKIESELADFVYDFGEKYTIEELLLLSDILITDYSSVIFDFCLLNRPIAFFADDLADYTKERDFYYDYKDFVPGPIFENSKDLAHWIKKGDFDVQKVDSFRDRFLNKCDGSVSKKVAELLFQSQ